MRLVYEFGDLTAEEQVRAMEMAENRLLKHLCEDLRFADPGLQATLMECVDEMNRMGTPWFLAEKIMEEMGDVVREIAREDAEDCLYNLTQQYVVSL